MLEMRGSKASWAAAFVLAFTGCAGEADEQKQHSPPSEIVTVPENDGASPETPAEQQAPAEPGVSRAEYIASADRLCGQYLPRIRDLENRAEAAAKDGDYDETADRFELAVAESEREVAALRELPVPEGSEAILSRVYAGVEESNRLFRGSIDKLRSGEVAAFNTLGEKARTASVRSKGIAAGFGFRVCGQTE